MTILNLELAEIKARKQRLLERRLEAFVTKRCGNGEGYCGDSQATIAKLFGVRKQRVAEAFDSLVARGRCIRGYASNRNRKNEKHYYVLPHSKPLGNSNKSLFNKSDAPEEKFSYEVRVEDLTSLVGETRLELISKYLDAGFILTPLVRCGKKPLAGWTKAKAKSTSREELIDFLVANEDVDVGCWMPGNLLAVDVDDPAAFQELTGGEEFHTLTSTSGRGYHLWFVNDGSIRSKRAVRKGLDYKTAGSLMVLPPSAHHSGCRYEWSRLVAPLDTPQIVKELYVSPSEAVTAVPSPPVATNAAPYLTKATVIPKGKRHDELFRFGRHLRKYNDAATVTAMLYEYNKACCELPLDDKRMTKLINQVLFGKERRAVAG